MGLHDPSIPNLVDSTSSKTRVLHIFPTEDSTLKKNAPQLILLGWTFSNVSITHTHSLSNRHAGTLLPIIVVLVTENVE
jgi:hypothetical protein